MHGLTHVKKKEHRRKVDTCESKAIMIFICGRQEAVPVRDGRVKGELATIPRVAKISVNSKIFLSKNLTNISLQKIWLGITVWDKSHLCPNWA